MSRRSQRLEGKPVPKVKKKTSKGKNDKKASKKGGIATAAAKTQRKASKSLKALKDNPLVADVVAAALVGMASALKDSDKARRLAGNAGEQLSALSKTSAKQGSAMWELALDIGRRTIETLASDEAARVKRRKSR
jgi:hypothetical protein